MRIISKADAQKGTLQVQVKESAESAPKSLKGQVVTVVDSTGGKGGGTYTIKNGAGKKVTGLRACDLAAHKPLTEVFGQKSSSKS